MGILMGTHWEQEKQKQKYSTPLSKPETKKKTH
jgi:hypothetical protein